MEDTERALVFLGHFNWLALTVARSLESPPRSLDMEIYRKEREREGGELFLFCFMLFYLTFKVSGDPNRPSERVLTTSTIREKLQPQKREEEEEEIKGGLMITAA